jgi:CHAT domain-containing protein
LPTLRLSSRVLLLALVMLSASCGQSRVARARIAPGDSRSGTLDSGQERNYEVALWAGQYVEVSVVQRGIDLRVRIRDPDGRTVADESFDHDRQNGHEDPVLLARTSGVYVITIASCATDAGRYELLLSPARRPTAEQTRRAESESVWLAAVASAEKETRADRLEALRLYGEVLRQWRDNGDRKRACRVLLAMARVHLRLRDQQAEGLDAEALADARARGDRGAEAEALAVADSIAFERGDYLASLSAAGDGLAIARAEKDASIEARLQNDLGMTLVALEEPQAALAHLQRALALAHLGRPPGWTTWVRMEIASAYARLGDAQLALASLAAASEGVTPGSYERGLIERMLGQVSLDLSSDFVAALAHFRSALETAQRLGITEEVPAILEDMGRVQQALGRISEATETELRGARLARELGEELLAARLTSDLGLSYALEGRLDEAEAALNAARAPMRKAHSIQDEADVEGRLALTWQKRGNLARAIAHAEQAIAIVENAPTPVAVPILRSEYFSRYCDYYDQAVDLLLEPNKGRIASANLARAFAVHEQSKARTLLDILSSAGARLENGIDPPLVSRRDRARQIVHARSLAYRQLAEQSSSPVQLSDAAEALDAAVRDYRAAEAQLSSASPRYAAITGVHRVTLAAVQERLPADTVLLEYALGKERSHLWWITAHAAEVYTLPDQRTIEAAARATYEQLIARNRQLPDETPSARRARIDAADRTVADAARRLGQMVLGPVAARLQHQSIWLVLDGALTYVPFSILPDAAEHPLIADHEIAQLPSASALLALYDRGRTRARPARSIAVLADPVFARSDPRVSPKQQIASSPAAADLVQLHRLTFTRHEAEVIAALAPSGQSRVALDFAASRAFLDEVHGFGILHFATHGILDSERPDRSGLVLSLVDRNGEARPGLLRLPDIYDLDLNADLVVLSACETALGKQVRGEGVIGLTEGFLFAGAQQVVATLWKIDDRSTAELMDSFYRGLLHEGLTPPAALRRAQLRLAQSSRWNAPYYWAPFVLQGGAAP